MPVPVQIRFVTVGAKEAEAAFASLSKRIETLAKAQMTASRASVRTATKSANDNAKADIAAERAAINATRQAAKEKERIRAQESKSAARASEAKARAAERAAEQEIKAARRVGVEEVRIRRQVDREMTRDRQKAARESARLANMEARESRRQRVGMLGTVGRAGSKTLGMVGSVAGTMGLMGGAYAVQAGLSSAMANEREAVALSNAVGGKVSAKDISARANKASMETGLPAAEIIASMAKAAEVGGGVKGLDMYLASLDDVQKTAVAAKVDIEEMANVMAIASNFGVKGGEEMNDLMRSFVAQGRAGQVEFRDLADQLSMIAATGLRMDAVGVGNIKKMGAMAQIAIRSRGTPEMARTSISSMFSELTQGRKARALGQAGVNVYTKSGQMRNIDELLADTIGAIEGGASVQLGKGRGMKWKGESAYSALFGAESNPVIQDLKKEYKNAGGGEAGKKRIMDMFAQYEKATLTSGQRDAEFNKVMGTSSAQVDVAKAKFNAEIAKLLPEFAKLAPQLAELGIRFAKIVVWMGQNPFKSLGVIFAGYLAKELAMAKVGDLIRNAISGGGSGGIGGVGGGGVGKAGAALGVIGAGVAGFSVGQALVDAVWDPALSKSQKSGADTSSAYLETLNKGSVLLSRARSGTLSDKDREEALKMAQKMRQYGSAVAENNSGSASIVDPATGKRSIALPMEKRMFRESSNYSEQQFAQLAANLEKVAAAADTASKNLSKVQPGGADQNRKDPASALMK